MTEMSDLCYLRKPRLFRAVKIKTNPSLKNNYDQMQIEGNRVF